MHPGPPIFQTDFDAVAVSSRERWLKDRKGRTLSDEDIAHYQRIIVALSETIRLRAKIDRVIDEHGDWPSAFQTNAQA